MDIRIIEIGIPYGIPIFLYFSDEIKAKEFLDQYLADNKMVYDEESKMYEGDSCYIQLRSPDLNPSYQDVKKCLYHEFTDEQKAYFSELQQSLKLLENK